MRHRDRAALLLIFGMLLSLVCGVVVLRRVEWNQRPFVKSRDVGAGFPTLSHMGKNCIGLACIRKILQIDILITKAPRRFFTKAIQVCESHLPYQAPPRLSENDFGVTTFRGYGDVGKPPFFGDRDSGSTERRLVTANYFPAQQVFALQFNSPGEIFGPKYSLVYEKHTGGVLRFVHRTIPTQSYIRGACASHDVATQSILRLDRGRLGTHLSELSLHGGELLMVDNCLPNSNTNGASRG